MKDQAAPMLDAGLSALIADLDERGLLSETLVVAVGEFGRSPQRGVSTSGNGNNDDGRDHWPYCYTACIAGAGVKRGFVYGKSDKTASAPLENPVHPKRAAGHDLPQRRHRPGHDRLQPPEPAARAGPGRHRSRHFELIDLLLDSTAARWQSIGPPFFTALWIPVSRKQPMKGGSRPLTTSFACAFPDLLTGVQWVSVLLPRGINHARA